MRRNVIWPKWPPGSDIRLAGEASVSANQITAGLMTPRGEGQPDLWPLTSIYAAAAVEPPEGHYLDLPFFPTDKQDEEENNTEHPPLVQFHMLMTSGRMWILKETKFLPARVCRSMTRLPRRDFDLTGLSSSPSPYPPSVEKYSQVLMQLQRFCVSSDQQWAGRLWGPEASSAT